MTKRVRERRCVATGETLTEDRLIRFVADPQGVVVPDLDADLPGRGMWVRGTRAALEKAVAKNDFARSAKARVTPPPELPDLVARLTRDRLIKALGLAAGAGGLPTGLEKVRDAVKAARAEVLIEAADGSADGRAKVLAPAAALDTPPLLIGCFEGTELDLALGRANVVHGVVERGRFGALVRRAALRYAGFAPLVPAEWDLPPRLASAQSGF